MPEAAFVLSTDHDPSLRNLVETVRYELELQAVPSRLDIGRFPEPRPERVYVLLDPWAYVASEGEAALPDDAVLRRTIFLVDEPAPAPAEAAHRALLARAGDVFAFDPRTRLALERLEIACRLLRPGYSASLDRFDPDAERPIDLAFVGTRTDRRARHLDQATTVLARYRSVVSFHEPDPVPDDHATASSEPGPALLSQAKIVLNVHGGDDNALEWRQVIDAVHAGAVVVTEHSHGIAPLIPGEHLLVASADAVPYVAEALLREGERLALMRVAAHDRLRTWLPFAFPVSVLRAALVELVGEPLPAGASLGHARSGPQS